jgi:hypothetical protein
VPVLKRCRVGYVYCRDCMYFRLLLERHFGFKLISQSSQHNCLRSATEPDVQSSFAFCAINVLKATRAIVNKNTRADQSAPLCSYDHTDADPQR